jgi:nitrogen regulatory protein PII
MKLITAVIRPEQLNLVLEGLFRAQVHAVDRDCVPAAELIGLLGD